MTIVLRSVATNISPRRLSSFRLLRATNRVTTLRNLSSSRPPTDQLNVEPTYDKERRRPGGKRRNETVSDLSLSHPSSTSAASSYNDSSVSSQRRREIPTTSTFRRNRINPAVIKASTRSAVEDEQRTNYRTILDWSIHPTVDSGMFSHTYQAQPSHTFASLSTLAFENEPASSEYSTDTSAQDTVTGKQEAGGSNSSGTALSSKPKIPSIERTTSHERPPPSPKFHDFESDHTLFDKPMVDYEAVRNQWYKVLEGEEEIGERVDDIETNTYDGISQPDIGDLLFTPNVVLPAIRNGMRSATRLFVCDDPLDLTEEKASRVMECIKEAKRAGIEVVETDPELLNEMVHGYDHEGVVLRATALKWPWADKLGPVALSTIDHQHSYDLLLKTEGESQAFKRPPRVNPVWLAVDDVLDPQVLGGLLRTAVAMDVDGVVICDRTCSPLTSLVAAYSGGALEFRQPFRVRSLMRFLRESKENGWYVTGVHSRYRSEQDRPMYSWPAIPSPPPPSPSSSSTLSAAAGSNKNEIWPPTILVVGEGHSLGSYVADASSFNRRQKLRKPIAEQCDSFIRIPSLFSSLSSSFTPLSSGSISTSPSLESLSSPPSSSSSSSSPHSLSPLSSSALSEPSDGSLDMDWNESLPLNVIAGLVLSKMMDARLADATDILTSSSSSPSPSSSSSLAAKEDTPSSSRPLLEPRP